MGSSLLKPIEYLQDFYDIHTEMAAPGSEISN